MRALLIAGLFLSASVARADVRKTQKDYGISGGEHVSVSAERGDFLAYRVAVEAEALYEKYSLTESRVVIWVFTDLAAGYAPEADVRGPGKYRSATIFISAHGPDDVMPLLRQAMAELAGADRV